ncbi:hypothetical protein J6590_042683 [Homalodisca vitripennis]|nr:hypothetical protein J6590_042683 [Homalodisca vitripennis]
MPAVPPAFTQREPLCYHLAATLRKQHGEATRPLFRGVAMLGRHSNLSVIQALGRPRVGRIRTRSCRSRSVLQSMVAGGRGRCDFPSGRFSEQTDRLRHTLPYRAMPRLTPLPPLHSCHIRLSYPRPRPRDVSSTTVSFINFDFQRNGINVRR